MHSAQPRAPHEGTLPQTLFHGGIIGKTDNAHRVYYETINVRYTLVQSILGKSSGHIFCNSQFLFIFSNSMLIFFMNFAPNKSYCSANNILFESKFNSICSFCCGGTLMKIIASLQNGSDSIQNRKYTELTPTSLLEIS